MGWGLRLGCVHAETIEFLRAETLAVLAMATVGLPKSGELTDSIKNSDFCNPVSAKADSYREHWRINQLVVWSPGSCCSKYSDSTKG